MKTISIVGIGRLGGALAIALSRGGFVIEKLIYRSKEPAPNILEKLSGTPDLIPFDRLTEVTTDVLFIAVPDTELGRVAEMAAHVAAASSVVLHTSGALSSDVLSPFARGGNETGSMHPLVSVSDAVTGAENFSGAYFCVEGSPAASACAERLARAIGGTPFSIDSAFKPLYHASAVMASGHVVSLFAAAVETLTKCGVEPAEAKKILFPLVKSAVANLERQETHSALTGPFARTDLEAVARHLKAFDEAQLSGEESIYLELGLKALQLAEVNGSDPEQIALIRNAIKFALGSGR